ncbi:hypothetical protein V2G26_007667 [Clonostachys chloroleuca]
MSDSTTIIFGVIGVLLTVTTIILAVVGLWLMEKVAKEIPETSYQPLPVKFANWRREVRKSLRELWRSLTAMVWGSVLAWLLGSRRWDRPSSAAV